MIGERESGIAASKGPSFIPEVVAAIKGDDAVETNVLPLPFALSERLWVQMPESGKNFHTQISSKRWMFFHSRQLSYQIFPPCSFLLETQM